MSPALRIFSFPVEYFRDRPLPRVSNFLFNLYATGVTGSFASAMLMSPDMLDIKQVAPTYALTNLTGAVLYLTIADINRFYKVYFADKFQMRSRHFESQR